MTEEAAARPIRPEDEPLPGQTTIDEALGDDDEDEEDGEDADEGGEA